MAAGLGMRVTAEIVETPEQARLLCTLGCDALQGFYFSKPVAAGSVPALAHRLWPGVGAERAVRVAEQGRTAPWPPISS